MAAIVSGTQAPDFSLKTTRGVALKASKVLESEPLLLLAFFKVSCHACQLAFPYLERLHRAYPQRTIWGISQDDLDATMSFARTYGLSFPILLDEDLNLTVKYGLTIVPSIFLLDRARTVQVTSEGFVRDELEQINKSLWQGSGKPLKALFTEADYVPPLRPGCASKQPG
jgi:peroxiredoxin